MILICQSHLSNCHTNFVIQIPFLIQLFFLRFLKSIHIFPQKNAHFVPHTELMCDLYQHFDNIKAHKKIKKLESLISLCQNKNLSNAYLFNGNSFITEICIYFGVCKGPRDNYRQLIFRLAKKLKSKNVQKLFLVIKNNTKSKIIIENLNIFSTILNSFNIATQFYFIQGLANSVTFKLNCTQNCMLNFRNSCSCQKKNCLTCKFQSHGREDCFLSKSIFFEIKIFKIKSIFLQLPYIHLLLYFIFTKVATNNEMTNQMQISQFLCQLISGTENLIVCPIHRKNSCLHCRESFSHNVEDKFKIFLQNFDIRIKSGDICCIIYILKKILQQFKCLTRQLIDHGLIKNIRWSKFHSSHPLFISPMAYAEKSEFLFYLKNDNRFTGLKYLLRKTHTKPNDDKYPHLSCTIGWENYVYDQPLFPVISHLELTPSLSFSTDLIFPIEFDNKKIQKKISNFPNPLFSKKIKPSKIIDYRFQSLDTFHNKAWQVQKLTHPQGFLRSNTFSYSQLTNQARFEAWFFCWRLHRYRNSFRSINIAPNYCVHLKKRCLQKTGFTGHIKKIIKKNNNKKKCIPMLTSTPKMPRHMRDSGFFET